MKQTMKIFKVISSSLAWMILFSFTGCVTQAAGNIGEERVDISLLENINITPPIDPINPGHLGADPDTPGTGNKGPLSIDAVTNLRFGLQKISDQNKLYHALNKHPYVQVTDGRGTGSGWSLSAQSTEFVSANGVLKGARLVFTEGEVKSVPENVSAHPMLKKIAILSKASTTVMFAKRNQGSGTWLAVWPDMDNGIFLDVIGATATTGVYSADVIWTLSDAPQR